MINEDSTGKVFRDVRCFTCTKKKKKDPLFPQTSCCVMWPPQSQGAEYFFLNFGQPEYCLIQCNDRIMVFLLCTLSVMLIWKHIWDWLNRNLFSGQSFLIFYSLNWLICSDTYGTFFLSFGNDSLCDYFMTFFGIGNDQQSLLNLKA